MGEQESKQPGPMPLDDVLSARISNGFDSESLASVHNLINSMELEIIFLQINIDACESSSKKEVRQQGQECADRQETLRTIVQEFKQGNPESLIAYANNQKEELVSESQNISYSAERRARLATDADNWSQIANMASSLCRPQKHSLQINLN